MKSENKKSSNERNRYFLIKEKIEELFRPKSKNVHFEITGEGNFSNELKKEIPDNRNLIFHFLTRKSDKPDISGFARKEHLVDFIIIEVKKEEIKLNDIYQTMRYKDLFDAKYAFLVSFKPIPVEIKKFCNIPPYILTPRSIHQFFVLVQFDKESSDFVDWFPENPFGKDLYWR